MFFTYLYNLLHKIFTFANICKVFIISFVGFLSRALVNHTWDINVFVEFTDPISLLYYLFFSIFIVWLHSFSSLFESYATSFPNIVELFNSLFRLFNINIKSIPNINLDALKLSSIRRALQSNYFFTKLPLTRPDTDTDIGTGTVEKKPLCSFNKHSDSARGSTKNSGGHGLRHRGGTRNLRDLSNSSDQTPRSSRPSRPAGPSGHRTVTQPVSSHISSRTRTLDQSHTYNNKPQTQPIPQRGGDLGNIPISNDNYFSKTSRIRRSLHWYMWEKFHTRFNSHSDFNYTWNSNVEVSKEILGGIKDDLYRGKKKVILFKDTFKWFINPGNRGKRG